MWCTISGMDSAVVAQAHACRCAHLCHDTIAQAVGAKPRAVRGWLAGRSSPKADQARRLSELAEITERLARVIDVRFIPMWMVRPTADLDQRTPVEAMASGQGERVARLVSGLEYAAA